MKQIKTYKEDEGKTKYRKHTLVRNITREFVIVA